MFNNSNEVRKRMYDQERGRRWNMAGNNEEPAVQLICDIIKTKQNNLEVTFERYDEEWFEAYDITLAENEWVKGCSDYLVTLKKPSSEPKFLYMEIKIKAETYRKTNYGGTTRAGSYIPRYNCESYYLDVEPVWKNICDFIEANDLDPDSFWLAFVTEDISSVNVITAGDIMELLENGWGNGYETVNIAVYSEGYGKPAYLIPVNSTYNLNHLDFEDIWSCAEIKKATP
ncbi:hypothetical protein [Lysinibacillus capsici]|uniref:hypothetical protein n=1 Tax=Lysinibacillus capsici TaxID=2115968 RepID=UPI00325FAA46